MASDTDSSDAFLTASDRSRETSPAVQLSGAFDQLNLSAIAPERPATTSSGTVHVLLQDACRQHKYRRTTYDADIVERPQRLRAINIGVAAAWARRGGDAALAVAAQMDRLALGISRTAHRSILSGSPFTVTSSSATLSLAADTVAFVHSESNVAPGPCIPAGQTTPTRATVFPTPAYPLQLAEWVRDCAAAYAEDRSEVPSHLPQGDLYLCPGTLDAVEGALGTSCAAVDEAFAHDGVCFAAIRPPGHHCGTASPSGFCLVNNVLVAAAHAYERYGCDRVIIFDIDLHHGDGTQAIVQRLNSESEQAAARLRRSTPRKTQSPRARTTATPSPQRTMGEKASAPSSSDTDDPAPVKRPLKLLYASLHDIASFPCEDGDPDRVSAASMRISGGHGQFVCNVHLDDYETDSDFHARLYPDYRSTLFGAATDFMRKTSADPARTLIVISAGFDASEHELSVMQRHGKRVPTSFFSRFAADVRDFAAAHAASRLVAILEGGYSDRALLSGVASLIDGFLGHHSHLTTTWDVKTLNALERACEGKSPSARGGATADAWLSTAQSAFSALEGITVPASSSSQTATPVQTRELRERKPKATAAPTGGDDVQTPSRRVAGPRGRAVSGAPVATNGLPRDVEVPPPVPRVPLRDLVAEPVKADRDVTVPDVLPPPALGKIRFTFKAGDVVSDEL